MSVEVLSKSVTFLDFRLSQGSVAIYHRWGGDLCDAYIENFLTNHLVRKIENRSTFAKVIIKHQTAYFFGTRCITIIIIIIIIIFMDVKKPLLRPLTLTPSTDTTDPNRYRSFVPDPKLNEFAAAALQTPPAGRPRVLIFAFKIRRNIAAKYVLYHTGGSDGGMTVLNCLSTAGCRTSIHGDYRRYRCGELKRRRNDGRSSTR